MDKQEILKVKMLGGFSLEYAGKRVALERNNVTRANQILQMVLQAGTKGVSKEWVMEQLYGNEDISNPAGNLRIVIYRLRQACAEAGLPESEYIYSEKGILFWTKDIPVEVDVCLFEKLISEAAEAEDKEEIVDKLEKAVELYEGEFLSTLGVLEWKTHLVTRYKDMYFKAVSGLCKILMNEREYDKVLRIASYAARLYPFDEWEVQKIDALMGMKRFKEAMKLYQDTAKRCFEELGTAPSERMMKRFEQMSYHLQNKAGNFNELRGMLEEEEDIEGAYFCSYPSFRESYRYIRRLVERTGQSAYLMSCTIVDRSGITLKSGERLNMLSEDLKNAVRKALRKGDLYSQYSQSQFVMLLMEIKQEQCSIVMSRIEKLFLGDNRRAKNYLKFQIANISEVSDTKKMIYEP